MNENSIASTAEPNHKKDYFVVSLIGLAFGLLLLPVLGNIKLPFLRVNIASAFFITLFFILFANFALWVAFLIGRRIPVMLQFAKFGAVGAFSTLFDFGILNILISTVGIATGVGYSLFKAISFICANVASYFLNRYWTFGIQRSANVKEFGQFFIVSVIGFILNVAIASFVVNFLTPPAIFTPERWANLGAFLATLVALIWNFLGYKFIVFKK